MAVGVMSIDLPILATVAGASGNVLPNTITLLASPVPGIDFLSNATATIGGGDPETDVAFRARFANFWAARSRATVDAIGYAISSVRSNLSYAIQENMNPSGQFTLGSILIIVADGSGSLSDDLLNSLSLSIEAVRPIGSTFSIQPPQSIQVQVSLSVELPPDSSPSGVEAELATSLASYINQRPIGSTLSITRISQVVYQTERQIINVSNITINDQAIDLIAPATGSFISQSINFI
jgi:uncharacterized phage protein gp47/JayE